MLNQPSPLDLAFQALADPTRRAMVERLARSPASVSDLARPFSMSLPAVMQHLAVLESSGLVVSEKVGRVRTCRIEPRALSLAEQWINARRTEWEHRLDRLGDYLENLKKEGDEDARANEIKSGRRQARRPLVISRTSRAARSGVQGVEQRRAHQALVQPRGLYGARGRDRFPRGRRLRPVHAFAHRRGSLGQWRVR